LKRNNAAYLEAPGVGEVRWRDEGLGESGDSGWYAHVRQGWSGGVTFVPIMKAVDLGDRHDAALAVRSDRARNRRVLIER
jgi:hypothetical protein